ncbi:13493_t:CDS:1, partial [Racocetra persica]
MIARSSCPNLESIYVSNDDIDNEEDIDEELDINNEEKDINKNVNDKKNINKDISNGRSNESKVRSEEIFTEDPLYKLFQKVFVNDSCNCAPPIKKPYYLASIFPI